MTLPDDLIVQLDMQADLDGSTRSLTVAKLLQKALDPNTVSA